jgi:hypothetical protein
MLERERIEEAVRFARDARHILLLALDEKGYPFCTPAERIVGTADDELLVTGWWYADTVERLRENSRVGLLVWDEQRDICYQIRGNAVSLQEIDVYDGYAIGEESEPLLPQAEWSMRISTQRVIKCVFRYSAHRQGEGLNPY